LESRHAFTLFELILAIALSVALLALIGTAINLYLLRVDASRTNVEEAQLARSVLAMIADDLRATTIYKPQDTSAIATLISSSGSFDVDSIDDPEGGDNGGGGGGGGGGSGRAGGAGAAGVAGAAGSTTGGSTAGGSGASTSMSAEDLTMPLGLNATLSELYVDVEHPPSMEELFRTNSGYTNTNLPTATAGPTVAPMRPSNVKTVRYFIRPGQQLAAGSPAITSLSEADQMAIGGLMRQSIDRPMRVFAEMSGNQAVLDSGQSLIAPEVVHIEFRFFDGTQILDYWDTKERGALPPAIEVRIWIADPNYDGGAASSSMGVAGLPPGAREYRQIVHLPMSLVGGSGGMGGQMSGTPPGTSSSGASSSSMSSSGTGASFGAAP
jgi:hypothetical protein